MTSHQRPSRARLFDGRLVSVLMMTTALAGLALPAAAETVRELQVAQTAPERKPMAFDIDAQPLDSALNQFGRQAGLQVTMPAAAAAGQRSAGVSGRFTPGAALARLLAGTGLVYEFTAPDTVSISKPPETGSATMLAPITVEGVTASDPGRTEDSGSYTTSSMNTATGLPLTMRETPQATTVITRQRMDDLGMADLNDVIQNTPGVYLGTTDGAGRASALARGFYIDKITYDGATSAYWSLNPNAESNLAMYDRVEVVRGATGLMQGSGSPSAAVNLVRKRPTEEFRGSVDGRLGSWEKFGGTLDLGGPLLESGRLRGRMVVDGQDSESFRDAETHTNALFYGILEADLTERTTLTFGAYDQKDNTNGGWWGGLPTAADGSHLDLSRSTSFSPGWEYLDQQTTAYFGDIEHRFDNGWAAKFAAMTSLSDNESLGAWIYGTETATGVTREHWAWRGDVQNEMVNYDASVTGPVTLFGREHDLIFGASHNEQEQITEGYDTVYLGNDIDIYDFDRSSVAKPDLPFSGRSRDLTTEDSLRAATRISVLERLKVILGTRIDWYDFDDKTGTGDYSVDANVTKYAGIIYDVDSHHSVYASYTDIFDPQSEEDVSGTPVKPIVGENYEIGVKGEYLGGALNASVAVFQADQTNRATEVQDLGQCTTASYCYEAAGLVRSRGIDMEVQGAVTQNWQVGAGYTYTRTEYVDDPYNDEGTRFNTTLPEHLFKLSTVYSLADYFDGWRVGGSLYWQSKIYEQFETAAAGAVRNAQDAYGIVNLMVGYRPMENLDLQLNVNNLFDETYYKSVGYGPTWGSTEWYGEPRNVLLTARYTF